MTSRYTSIRVKAVFLLLLLAIIPVLSLGIAAYTVSSRIIISDLDETALKAMQKTASDIDAIINDQHVMLDNLAENVEILAALNADETEENVKRFNKLLLRQLANMNADMTLYAVSADGRLLSTRQLNDSDAADAMTAITGFVHYPGNLFIQNTVQDAGVLPSIMSGPFPARCFYTYRNVTHDGEYMGTFICEASEYRFSRLLNNVKTSNIGYIYVSDSTGNIIIHEDNHADPSDDIISAVAASKTANGDDTLKIDGEYYVICHTQISSQAWQIVMITPYSSFYAKLVQVQYIVIGSMTISVLMVLLLVYLMNRNVVTPVSQLSKLMKEVEKGNLSVRARVDTDDEIGVLNRGFNRMLGEVQALMDKAVHFERSQKALQFRALQEQIKPHFLYNTLNTIRWIAELQNAGIVAEAIVTLGRLLEYKYSQRDDNDFVKVEEEMQYLKDYIYLQQLRYIDAFTCCFSIDEKAAGCKIIKFILQPFVENSIIHGFRDIKSGGVIDISVRIESDSLLIRVADNGVGISSEGLRQLNSDLGDQSIGIPNVRERLRLNYSGDYLLEFLPGTVCGTIVQMRLPIDDASIGVDKGD